MQEKPEDIDVKDKLITAQMNLETHYRRIERGHALRAKIQCYEEGEKSSKFFLNQAKQNNRKSTIRRLKIGEGEITREITNPTDILYQLESFYTDLYTSRVTAETIEKMDAWIE